MQKKERQLRKPGKAQPKEVRRLVTLVTHLLWCTCSLPFNFNLSTGIPRRDVWTLVVLTVVITEIKLNQCNSFNTISLSYIHLMMMITIVLICQNWAWIICKLWNRCQLFTKLWCFSVTIYTLIISMTSPTFCSWFYRKSQVVKAKEFYVLLTKQADGIFSHSACSVV